MRIWPALLGFALVATGCMPVAEREQLLHNTGHDWQAFKDTRWTEVGRQVTGLDQTPLTAQDEAVAAAKRACAADTTAQRQTRQNGINDAVDYSRCPGSRADPQLGQRLAPRDM